jgi:polysaccharide export outer membrane protein
MAGQAASLVGQAASLVVRAASLVVRAASLVVRAASLVVRASRLLHLDHFEFPLPPPAALQADSRATGVSRTFACLVLLALLSACGGGFPNLRQYDPSLMPNRYQEALEAAKGLQGLQAPSQETFVYRIHPTDVLDIKVFEYPEMNVATRVSVAGNINFPPVGEILAAGKTQEELQQTIVDKLTGEFLKNPQMIISVTEAKSLNVSILGEVNIPGQKTVIGEARLLDVLAQVGGVTAKAGTVAYLVRDNAVPAVPTLPASAAADTSASTAGTAPSGGAPANTTGRDSAYRVYLAGLLQRGERDWNIMLRPGDVLTVPPAGTVHVTGPCIRKPGTYPLSFEPKTLTQMIDDAGGLTWGASRRIVLARCVNPEKDDKREFFWVDYTKVLRSPSGDVVMEAGDRLICVPSWWRRILERVEKIVSTTAVRYQPTPQLDLGLGQDSRSWTAPTN